MTLEEELRLLLGAYYGIQSMDEYDTKEFILRDIEQHINAFQKINHFENIDEIANSVKENVELKTKLQDSLIILNRINGPMDLILLIKNKIKEI